jgi:asparagine synthase (glutamine-hydrolysing)
LFGGYLTYRANRMARFIRAIPGATALGLAVLRHWPVSDEKMGFDYKATRLLEGSRMGEGRAHVYWNGTFAQEQLRTVVNGPLPASLNAILGEMGELPRNGDDLAPFLWLDQKYYLADDILTKSDRMSMAHSVEVRPAFLDHRIVEFAAKLPAKLKIDGSRQKVILKDLMKDKLPPAIIHRKKTGFDIPAHEWMRTILRDLLEDALKFGLSEYGDLFNRAGIEELNRRHQAREINVGYHLWGLLILFLWMKKWQVKVPALAAR